MHHVPELVHRVPHGSTDGVLGLHPELVPVYHAGEVLHGVHGEEEREVSTARAPDVGVGVLREGVDVVLLSMCDEKVGR